MGKHAEIAVPLVMISLGIFFLAVEWLCIDIFWTCVIYRPVTASIGSVLIITGAVILLAIIEYRNSRR